MSVQNTYINTAELNIGQIQCKDSWFKGKSLAITSLVVGIVICLGALYAIHGIKAGYFNHTGLTFNQLFMGVMGLYVVGGLLMTGGLTYALLKERNQYIDNRLDSMREKLKEGEYFIVMEPDQKAYAIVLRDCTLYSDLKKDEIILPIATIGIQKKAREKRANLQEVLEKDVKASFETLAYLNPTKCLTLAELQARKA